MKKDVMKWVGGLMLLPGLAVAIDHNNGLPFGLPEGLLDAKAAICRTGVDDKQATQSEDLGPSLEPDLSCALGVNEASPLLDEARTRFVDIRKQDQFEAFHINGALNMDVGQLVTKSYLRDSSLVLLGDGKSERELYLACTRLKQAGFHDVHVLQGGMTAWIAQNQPILGQAPSLPQLMRLAPAELLQESHFSNNLFVIVGREAVWKGKLPAASLLVVKPGQTLAAALKQRQKVKKSTIASLVVIGSEWREVQRQVENLRIQGQVPVLIFIGTPEEYQAAITTQKEILAAKNRPPPQPQCSL